MDVVVWRSLVIDMGCNCRNEHLCGCLVTVFSYKYVFSCSIDFGIGPLFSLLAGASLSSLYWPRVIGYWNIYFGKYGSAVCLTAFVFSNSHLVGSLGIPMEDGCFSLQVEMGLRHRDLLSGTLERTYNKGKESGTSIWYNCFSIMVNAWSCIRSFSGLKFYTMHHMVCYFCLFFIIIYKASIFYVSSSTVEYQMVLLFLANMGTVKSDVLNLIL